MKALAVVAAALFILSLVPIAMVAPYVRAAGDDLNYSAGVHRALQQGGGLSELLSAVSATVKNTWYSWQGTWSSVALFSLQPGIWGEKWYPLTVVIALLCVLGGTWYFLHVAGKRKGIGLAPRCVISCLTGILLIQYMPNMQCGIFWWTSVAHYCIPYGVTLVCMGWSLCWLDTGKKRYLPAICLGMSYLGGAGYPEVVLGAVWTFLLIVYELRGRAAGTFCKILHREKRTDVSNGAISNTAVSDESVSNITTANTARNAAAYRGLWLLLPFLLEMAGFAVSAAAPGNKNRGGESFGFSMGKVCWTLTACVKEGIAETLRYCIKVRPLLPALLMIVLILVLCRKRTAGIQSGGQSNSQSRIQLNFQSSVPLSVRPTVRSWPSDIAAVLAAGFVICIVRAPVLYAGTDASGGVPDSYWFITLTALIWLLETLLMPQEKAAEQLEQLSQERPLQENPERACEAPYADQPESLQRTEAVRMPNAARDMSTDKAEKRDILCKVGIVGIAAVLFLLSRHIIGGTVDYTCVQFIQSGALEDYHNQMEEWLEILHDPEITNAELPAMNNEQGPFMLMVPLDDAAAWSNSVYMNYYGKESVICVPRQ